MKRQQARKIKTDDCAFLICEFDLRDGCCVDAKKYTCDGKCVVKIEVENEKH